MIEALALILFAAGADRVRGGFPNASTFAPRAKPKGIDVLREIMKYLYGMGLALPVTDNPWLVLAAGPLWQLGTRQDFGGMFRVYWPDKPGGWWHILRVGAVWPLPVCALAYWDLGFLLFLPASIVGNGLAHYCALRTPLELPAWALELRTKPAWSEVYRGAFVAAGLAAAGLFA